MADFTKENITALIYENVDSVVIVDIQNDSYQTLKISGVFEQILKDTGNYCDLVKKLWFHFNNSSNKITEDYQIFLPKLGKFSGKYSNRIKLFVGEVVYIVQIAIYPLDDQNNKYMFLLDELDNSEYIKDFFVQKKTDTIQNSYLFSMYVDLIKNTTNSVNVAEISTDSINYDVSYSDWRNMIVNMFLPDDQATFMERTNPEYLKQNLKPGKTTSFDCQMKNLEGVFIWVKLIFSRVKTNDEEFKFVFMVQDIDEETKKILATLKKYEDLASKDTLTNVFNHGRIEKEICEAITTVKSTGQKISLMMFDIDYFKRVNDKFGHSVGDLILKRFVELLNDFFEPHNIVMGRWGGEEFICVCYGSSLNDVKLIAEQARKLVETEKFEKIESLTCSIGLTEILQNDECKSVFDRVDCAMYHAKETGRNCIVVR